MCIRDSIGGQPGYFTAVFGDHNIILLLYKIQVLAETLLEFCCSYHNTFLIPVSYTHLDVYKRQDQHQGDDGEEEGSGLNRAVGGV